MELRQHLAGNIELLAHIQEQALKHQLLMHMLK
jgi:hypothetical protein